MGVASLPEAQFSSWQTWIVGKRRTACQSTEVGGGRVTKGQIARARGGTNFDAFSELRQAIAVRALDGYYEDEDGEED